MIYDQLPIYKSALSFVVYIENLVKQFDKYHKYTIGVDLRKYAQKILFLIHRANISREKIRYELLCKLRDICEDTKMLIVVSKELKAFSSFKSFEHSSKLIVDICKQSQSWLNSTARALG